MAKKLKRIFSFKGATTKHLVSAGGLQDVQEEITVIKDQELKQDGRLTAFMLGPIITAFGFLLIFVNSLQAYTVVQASTAAPAGLEARFIAQTTTQFNTRFIVNPLVSNTQSITLFSSAQPQALIASSEEDCLSQGFGDGMDSEREATIKAIQTLQNIDKSSGTCGGFVASSTTATFCQYVYNLIGATISQRWLAVYTSTGGVVAP